MLNLDSIGGGIMHFYKPTYNKENLYDKNNLDIITINDFKLDLEKGYSMVKNKFLFDD
jgi:hypothetical protein